jgi:tetratricopeptide (TPR) repeat protein
MKRGNVKSIGRPVSKYFTVGAGLTLFILSLISACAPAPALRDQVAFGVWAAEKDLWDEAIFRWKKVLAENPDSVAAHNNLAVAYEKKGLWEEARKEYETALKLDPDNPWIKFNYENFQGNLESDGTDKEEDAEKREKK